MKLTRIGQGLIAAAACLGIGLGITSCNPGDTIDYLFVTSNSGTGANSGIVTSYHVNSYSGTLSQVAGNPTATGGVDPVADHQCFEPSLVRDEHNKLDKQPGAFVHLCFFWERTRDKPLTMMQDIAVRTTYAARTDGDDFLLSVIKDLQDADEKTHGKAYRQVFEASNHGWRERQAA